MAERDPSGFVSDRRRRPRTPPRTPSGTCSTRAASASPSATTTGSGSPTSAAPPTSSKWADNVLAEIARQGLGRRLHGRHQPEHGVALRRRPDGQVPDRRRPGRRRRARRWPRSARASAPRASSSSRTSASGRLPGGHQGLDAAYVDGGMNEQFVKWRHDDRAGYDRDRSGSSQLQAMKDAEAAGKYYLGITHSTATRPRGRPLRLRDDAAGRRRQARSSRCTATTPTRTGSRSTTTRSARPSARRDARARAASTGASSPTASSTSTRRRAPSRVDFGGAYTGSGLTNATATTLQAAQRPGAGQGR